MKTTEELVDKATEATPKQDDNGKQVDTEKEIINVSTEFGTIANLINDVLLNADNRGVVNQCLMNLKNAVNNQNGIID